MFATMCRASCRSQWLARPVVAAPVVIILLSRDFRGLLKEEMKLSLVRFIGIEAVPVSGLPALTHQ